MAGIYMFVNLFTKQEHIRQTFSPQIVCLLERTSIFFFSDKVHYLPLPSPSLRSTRSVTTFGAPPLVVRNTRGLGWVIIEIASSGM